jgi:hypothetical protein
VIPFPYSASVNDISSPIQFVDMSCYSDFFLDCEKPFLKKSIFSKNKDVDYTREQYEECTCCVALNSEVLRNIDPSIFKISSQLEQVVHKYYNHGKRTQFLIQLGYGFIIVSFSKPVGDYIIGFVHPVVSTKQLFVPFRQFFGYSNFSNDIMMDHVIYSANTYPEWGVSSDDMFPSVAPSQVVKLRRIGIVPEVFQAFRKKIIRGRCENEDFLLCMDYILIH